MSAPTPPRVDLADPAARSRWLDALFEDIGDAIGAGLDATDAPGNRFYGRKGARDVIAAAERSIDQLFAAIGYVPPAKRKPAAAHDATTGGNVRRRPRGKRGAP